VSYESHMEIYQPAYLFATNSAGNAVAATRPVISSAPATVGYGGTFTVQTPDAASINSVVLVRAGAVTHAFNMEQRLVGLAYTAVSGSLTVTGPPNSNVAPPGYYMLFLMNTAGVPSVASFVQVAPHPDFSVTVSPPQNAITPGIATDYSVLTVPSGGFTGTVNLSVTGLPSGINATLGASSVAQRASTTLNLDTSTLKPATLPVTYPITISAASGSLSRSARINLLVNSPGDFTVSTSSSSLTVSPGTSGKFTVDISPQSGFVGVVSFSISGLPSKVTSGFSSKTVTGSGTTTVTVSAAANAVPSTSTLTITATSGSLVHTATVSLTVQ
jgi:hypothetical protein